MASDMIVALKEASADGSTLFGLNHHAALSRIVSSAIWPASTADNDRHAPGQGIEVERGAIGVSPT